MTHEIRCYLGYTNVYLKCWLNYYLFQNLALSKFRDLLPLSIFPSWFLKFISLWNVSCKFINFLYSYIDIFRTVYEYFKSIIDIKFLSHQVKSFWPIWWHYWTWLKAIFLLMLVSFLFPFYLHFYIAGKLAI